MTLLSVLVPIKNEQAGFLATYESLKYFLGADVEIVVQDYKGQSRLLSVIDDPFVRVYEEDDKGPSQAINSLIPKATGKYLLFWGAGETAIPTEFYKLIQYLKTAYYDIIFNRLRVKGTNVLHRPAPERIEKDMACLTPAAVIRKNFFIEAGGTDERYSIALDYEMFVRFLSLTGNITTTEFVIVDFPLGGASNTARAYEGYLECELIRMRAYKKDAISAAKDVIKMSQEYLKAVDTSENS